MRPAGERRLAVGAVLVAILLAAAALRVLFGWPMPNRTRAYDEKFTLDNARRILVTGELAPASGFHPALSYLPQTALLAAVDACACVRLGTASERVLEENPKRRRREAAGRRLTPLAYRSCRLSSALFGVLAIYLVYRLGRRLSSPEVGLTAAALCAGAPWHVWASGICNEDAGLVLAVLAAAFATLAALRRPGAARFALAGGVVGLGLATKFNAGPVALPLAWASLWRCRRRLRYLAWLALAGASAVAVFLLLDLHYLLEFDRYFRDFEVTLRDYARKGRRQGHGLGTVLLAGLGSAADPLYLGLVAGALAAVGAAWILARDRAPRRGSEAPSEWWVIVSFPLTYVAVYALATRNVSPHNWLPVLPFAALLSAEGLSRLLDAAAGRLRPRSGARLARTGMAVLAVAGLARGTGYVYATLVPTTYDAAIEAVAARLDHGATVVHDVAVDPLWIGRRAARTRLLELGAADPGEIPAARRAAADAWITAAARPAGPGAQAGSESFLVEPELFVSRGETLRVTLREWRLLERGGFDLGRPERTGVGAKGGRTKRPGRRRLVYRGVRELTPPDGASWVSLELPIRGLGSPPRCELRVAGGGRRLLRSTRRPKEAGEIGIRGRRATRLALVSERIPVAELDRLELRCPLRAGRQFARRPQALFWAGPG